MQSLSKISENQYKIIFNELDANSRLLLLKDFDELKAEDKNTIYLNFDNVKHINNSGMLALIELNQAAIKENINLVFTGLRQEIKEQIYFKDILEIK
ncbi:MAG: STAS domain-containing protein [Chitinophagaceae bacterium]|nr:MAG: STAS domain-containing protein [Chitinophagaceae bacterium]